MKSEAGSCPRQTVRTRAGGSVGTLVASGAVVWTGVVTMIGSTSIVGVGDGRLQELRNKKITR
jgi:hypothetical protein